MLSSLSVNESDDDDGDGLLDKIDNYDDSLGQTALLLLSCVR